MDLTKLSAPERRALMRQLEAEQRKEKASKQKDIDAYKASVTKIVNELFEPLQEVSKTLAKAKQMVYNKTQSLLNKKASLYETSVNNQSHTFTNEDGTVSITIGYREIDGWDDTVSSGIAKVKKYISKVTAGDNDSKQVEFLKATVEKLLSKDAQGNLKASRVLELKKVAEKINSKELQDGIAIIESAYKPQRTKNFVSVMFKDAQGKQCTLPLSMTDAEIKVK